MLDVVPGITVFLLKLYSAYLLSANHPQMEEGNISSPVQVEGVTDGVIGDLSPTLCGEWYLSPCVSLHTQLGNVTDSLWPLQLPNTWATVKAFTSIFMGAPCSACRITQQVQRPAHIAAILSPDSVGVSLAHSVLMDSNSSVVYFTQLPSKIYIYIYTYKK